MTESLSVTGDSPEEAKPAWHPLPKIQRRIVGVLVEKAKTTPDQYPMSLNALTNGCNQKSNRSPQMSLEEHQVESALEKLRTIGVVAEVQGGGRVPKFRHYMKEWLGVSGVELAVMTELLLRGDQTVGDLRGRANRMTNNEIPDVGTLKPIVDSLIQKGLIIALTPAGRGQVVTHALYEEEELTRLREKFGSGHIETPTPRAPVSANPSPPPEKPSWTADDAPAAGNSGDSPHDGAQALRDEVNALREEVAKLKREVEDLWANFK